jgi:hypothetical protein
MLRRICGPRRDEVTGSWGKLHHTLHQIQGVRKRTSEFVTHIYSLLNLRVGTFRKFSEKSVQILVT